MDSSVVAKNAATMDDPFNKDLASVFLLLDSYEDGLTKKEAAKRLSIFGKNAIENKKKTSRFVRFLTALASPLVLALLIIALFSLFFRDVTSAILISLMAFLGVALSFIQEIKAENDVNKLLNMVQIKSVVLRNKGWESINTEDIVPGDIVKLVAGNMVPADLRVVHSKNFFVNQSSLTGESQPVEKTAHKGAHCGSILNLKNSVWMGTNIVGGTGIGLVVKTGTNTQFGELSAELIKKSNKTSFEKGISQFTWLMLRLIIGLSVIIFFINAVLKGDIVGSLLFSLAVAVGLVPEMLPVMINLNLTKGAIAMAKKKVIIKNLSSIQSFGAMDVLCTDKTGTLTLDEITLIKHCNLNGDNDLSVARLAYLNSLHQTGVNNVLDRAILDAHEYKTKSIKVDEIPYDNVRRILTVVEKTGKQIRLISKGAPEELVKKCSKYDLDGVISPITYLIRKKLSNQYKLMSQDGLIVLGLAYKEVGTKDDYSLNDESDLVFKGFIAFLDPPKPTALEAMKKLENLGISLKILSGDNEFVVKKICNELSINTSNLLTGSKMDKLTNPELKTRIEKASAFARLTPLQKEKVIQVLQESGHVVGFLGDGINDAPALKVSDVGISVNNAADIAKDTADIVLLEKSLLVLQDCVTDGRKTFRNVVKYIKMGASSNFGNMFSVTGASIFLPFLPMLPIQILLNNLLYDFSQATIPFDNIDEDSLLKPTPWNIDFIKKFMYVFGSVSSIFDFITFGILWFVFRASPGLFQSGWFIVSIFTQTLIVHIIRTKKIPFIKSKPSNLLLFSSVAVVLVGSIIVFSSVGKYFGFVQPSPVLFGTLMLIVIAYLLTTQVLKNWFVGRYGYE